jgi:hypothetical protein
MSNAMEGPLLCLSRSRKRSEKHPLVGFPSTGDSSPGISFDISAVGGGEFHGTKASSF